MELFVLLAALAAFAAFGTSIGRPMPQSVMVASRVLLLVVGATIAQAIFTQTRANDTAGQAVVLAIVVGWLGTLQTGRTIKPGTDGKTVWIESSTPESQDLVVAGAAALMLMAIVVLQGQSQAMRISPSRGDVASLVTFAICLGCWSVIVGAATLPWRLHRRWTVPLLLLVTVAFALYLPATWFLSGGDAPVGADRVYGPSYDSMPSYGGGSGADPFSRASSATSSFPRTTFAASASIIATNLLAILATVVMALRYLAARHIRFAPDDDATPMPGERTA